MTRTCSLTTTMFLREIPHNSGMDNSKFSCFCYSNISDVNIDIHYPLRDNYYIIERRFK